MTASEQDLRAAKVRAHLEAQRVFLDCAAKAADNDVRYFVTAAIQQGEAIGELNGVTAKAEQ